MSEKLEMILEKQIIAPNFVYFRKQLVVRIDGNSLNTL